MFVTNWISTTKIQKISEITNFFRHYFLSRTEVLIIIVFDLFNHQFICFTSLLVIISFLILCIKWYPRINEHGIVVCIRVLDPFLKMHKKIFINDLSLKLRKWHIF